MTNLETIPFDLNEIVLVEQTNDNLITVFKNVLSENKSSYEVLDDSANILYNNRQYYKSNVIEKRGTTQDFLEHSKLQNKEKVDESPALFVRLKGFDKKPILLNISCIQDLSIEDARVFITLNKSYVWSGGGMSKNLSVLNEEEDIKDRIATICQLNDVPVPKFAA